MRRLLSGRSSVAIAVAVCSALSFVSSARAEAAYLTPVEREQIVALVRADDRIREIIAGAELRTEDVAPWSHDGTRATLIGGGLTLEFTRPRTVEADWPLMDWSDAGGYTVTVVHYRVENADAIMAWIDLRKQEVVSFDVRDGEVVQSSIRYLDTPTEGEESSSRGTSSGRGALGVVVAGVAALVAVLAVGRIFVRRRAARVG
jgi:hypothetical protein